MADLALKNEISVSTPNLNLNDLSIKYSKRISDDLWFKIGFINLGASVRKNKPLVGSFNTTDTRLSGGLLIGIEKQASLSNRLIFIYGLNAQMSYNYSNHSSENPSIPVDERDSKVDIYYPGIGIGMGFFYQFNQNFLLGAEVNPSVNYYFEKNRSTSTGIDREGFDFSLSNLGALLTLKYRF